MLPDRAKTLVLEDSMMVPVKVKVVRVSDIIRIVVAYGYKDTEKVSMERRAEKLSAAF